MQNNRKRRLLCITVREAFFSIEREVSVIMKILFIGDIVGSIGQRYVRKIIYHD